MGAQSEANGVKKRSGNIADGTKQQDTHILGGTAIKPPEYHGMEKIRRILYNPDTGEFLTRTPKSWLLITIFYVIYYTCLACFWYGMLSVFFLTLPDNMPRYVLDESIIGRSPGIAVRPSQPSDRVSSSLIQLEAEPRNGNSPTPKANTDSNADYASRYSEFLSTYDNLTGLEQCSGDDPGDSATGANCIFDINVLGECGQNPYGYFVSRGSEVVSPCFLIKVNRIFGWIPDSYTDQDLDDPESEMPDSVVRLVRNNRNKIYVDCQGQNAADKEAINGKMTYFPSDQGISFRYFPYKPTSEWGKSKSNYHQPLVAVKFDNLPGGQLVEIECKLWTKGVKHSSRDMLGLTRFQIYLT